MRAQSDTQLVQLDGWTLRARPAQARPSRLLLLIHGWTGDENSMWVFARNLPPDYWVLAPRAPLATRPSGYSWRVAPPEGGTAPSLEDLRDSGNALIALVDTYCAKEGIPGPTLDAIGFSQGAALAGTLAFLYPKRIGKVGMLAGFIPEGAGTLLSERLLDGKRFFVAHGSMDETVSIEYARQSARLLETAGAQVTLCEDEVGHKVSAGCLRGLETFLA